MSGPLLEVSGLRVAFGSEAGRVDAVRGLDVTVERGKTVAIVGESGSGKSTTLHEIMGFAAPPGTISVNDMDPATTRGRTARALRQEIASASQAWMTRSSSRSIPLSPR